MWTLLECKIHRVSEGESLQLWYYVLVRQCRCCARDGCPIHYSDLYLWPTFGFWLWTRLVAVVLQLAIDPEGRGLEERRENEPLPTYTYSVTRHGSQLWFECDRQVTGGCTHAGVVAYIGALILSVVLDCMVTVTPFWWFRYANPPTPPPPSPRTTNETSWCDMVYLLTAIGLTPSGSSTVHIYTQTIRRTTQLTTLFGRLSGIRTQSGQTNWEECGPCPVFAIYTLEFVYNWGKST